MSEFDKEKEREKLREQFENEAERRQTTEQMSELLLKGATMLNVHCADCASPIFRYDGDEFCPDCGRTVEQLQQAGATEAANEQADATQPQASEAEADVSQPESPTEAQPAPAPQSVGDSMPQSNAGEALHATIARLADRAATADDPRQAKELLEAAHRAAETLVLVEGNGPT